MLIWLAFFFVAFGAKALLAVAMIYVVFSSERTCDECDAETLPMRMGPLGRTASALTFGSLQRRWCPRCRWEGLTRTGRLRAPAHAGAAADASTARR